MPIKTVKTAWNPFQSFGNTDYTLSTPQEQETRSLLALACLQAPGELTLASQYFHTEKNHSWGGGKKKKKKSISSSD